MKDILRKLCEEEGFITPDPEQLQGIWEDFLGRLGEEILGRIDSNGGELTQGLKEMWERIKGELAENSATIAGLIIAACAEREEGALCYCMVFKGLERWPNFPADPGAGSIFRGAHLLKVLIEELIEPGAPPHIMELFNDLNRLLCILDCL